MIEHTIADAIKKVSKGFVEDVHLDGVCPGMFERVCEDNHWYFEYNPETNGWEIDWWATITIDKQIIHVSGAMYDGTAHIFVW
jgi:hypothetical protein